MLRSLALASTVLAASLTASALSAQTSAPASKPAPTMSHAPSVHAKVDTGTAAAHKSSASAARHAVWTADQIKEAQAGLAKAGYYKGKTTGQFNGDTKKALRAYQKANKLPVTGRLSDDVLNKLKSA